MRSKRTRLVAAVFAAVLVASVAAGCKRKRSSAPAPEPRTPPQRAWENLKAEPHPVSVDAPDHARARLLPLRVAGIDDAIDLSAGGGSTCVARASGAVTCWGAIAQGREDAHGVSDAVRVRNGSDVACAVTRAGTVSCFEHEMGDTGLLPRSPDGLGHRMQAASVAFAGRVSAIAVADRFACALLEDATVRCWGDGSHGQLGDGTLESRTTPAPVKGLHGAAGVAVGGLDACSIDTSGAVSCWGGAEIRLRSMAETTTPVPSPLPLLDGTRALVLGHGIGEAALGTDGVVRPFVFSGYSLQSRGQDGPYAIVAEARGPISLRAAAEVVGGDGFACIRTGEGVVRCAGVNAMGELGDGTRQGRWEPADVAPLGRADQIAAGAHHACARASGAVFCWGDDSRGAVTGAP